MSRTPLVAYRSSQVTPDTAEGIRQIELRAASLGGVHLKYEGTAPLDFAWDAVASSPGLTNCPPEMSMRPTGREVRLRLNLAKFDGSPERKRREEVETLWGLAVPLGFTPWNRYPIAGTGDDVFHFFGPWQMLYDSLCGEGRGDLAWPSMSCAAQIDVGKWQGDRLVERTVQTHLHRLGVPCGPVDGVISERVLTSMRALGIKGLQLTEVASYLENLATPKVSAEGRRIGYLIIGDPTATAVANGKIALQKTPQGYALTIDGPGRVILDIGGSV